MKKMLEYLKKEKLLIFALIITAVFFALAFNVEKKQPLEEGYFRHTLEIESLGEFEVVLHVNSRAGEALDRAAMENGFDVEYKKFDFGRMVVRIGEKGGDVNYFWALYINNQLSNVGADALILNEGDRTEWKHERISF